MTEYEPVIGLEIHAQLLTQSKLFCGCSTRFGNEPNSNVCAVCLGLPGALPVLNGEALALAVRAALALRCTINERSTFARKQYFYPDLPKGYQISQYDEPFSSSGRLEIEVDGERREVGITRVHMEEDAGKSTHGVGGDSVVDLNRAGVPLAEIVGDPDLRSSAEASAYMKAVRDVLVFNGVNDGNLEEGSLRCDVNVSIRPKGSKELGTRVELKNINSFRFVQKAIESEVARQEAVLDGGGKIVQETRSFDPDTSKTATLRSKEEAHDYRYFPEPDLPPLVIDAASIDEQKRRCSKLPSELRREYEALGLGTQAAATLTQHPAYVRFFDEARADVDQPKRLANWILTEVLRDAKVHGIEAEIPVSPKQVAQLLRLVEAGDISGKQAKEVHAAMVGTDRLPDEIVEERGLRVVSDAGELEAVCRSVIDAHPEQAQVFRGGKKGVLGFFVGKVMKETGGSANPKMVSQLLSKLLEQP